ncbi:hypothetical protein HAX54_048320 [Datura stramonium]|uniref:Uncharacterized protein n=1 Tax=Datura stramonium TaxID=4076 RepID=A0ABS8WJ92_DATST|nr:hypothetical protein [Datura stramonium]
MTLRRRRRTIGASYDPRGIDVIKTKEPEEQLRRLNMDYPLESTRESFVVWARIRGPLDDDVERDGEK